MNDYKSNLEQYKEYGEVEQIHHPLVVVNGLPHVGPSELVIFESTQIGQVFSIEKEKVHILVFSRHPVRVGEKLVRTGKSLSVPVGYELMGMVIDPLGNSLSSGKITSAKQVREVDVLPAGISKRARVNRPFHTGVTIVDMMVPLGIGQKELIIGDRKTGKTSFILSTIKNQIKQGTICIYAAIGRKKHDIKKIEQFMRKEGIMDKVIMVATASHDSPSLISLTPFSAMAIAEYFNEMGQDVLLVLDDLSTHARFYREISLIGKRFPGRDSYPGDIFYLHSRLLERAGSFMHKKKEQVSITCLPVAEIIEGDLTGYITTNLMGMTDGHIFFDSNAYYQGRRPAINVSLSVTRVGRQTQDKLRRDISRELTAFLALYEKMQSFSHFGAELSESVKHILITGAKLYKFFDQSYSVIIPPTVQLVLFSMLWLKFVGSNENESITVYRDNLMQFYESNPKVKKRLDEIVIVSSFNGLLANVTRHKDYLLGICKTVK